MATTRLSRQDKRRANRARILRAAREVFARRGYHDAKIEDIGAEAGLSVGAVYYNFENKEDLFLALLDDWRAELIRDVEGALGSADGAATDPAQLREDIRRAVEMLNPSREWRLLLFEFVSYAARNPDFRARFVEGRRRFKSALTDLLEQRMAAARLPPGLPAEHLAVIMMALVNGLSVDELTEPDTVPSDLLGEAVNALLTAPV
jgi:AcrR family transcriptional regulator